MKFTDELDGLAEDRQSIFATRNVFKVFRFIGNLVIIKLSDMMYAIIKNDSKLFFSEN